MSLKIMTANKFSGVYIRKLVLKLDMEMSILICMVMRCMMCNLEFKVIFTKSFKRNKEIAICMSFLFVVWLC